jgi:hypothetical protein
MVPFSGTNFLSHDEMKRLLELITGRFLYILNEQL